MTHITAQAFVSMLEQHPIGGSKVVELVSATRPKMLVKCRITGEPNPHMPEGVERLASRRIILGASYENAVNKQRVAEQGTTADYFDAASLWHGKGERAGSYTVRHIPTGKLYLFGKPEQKAAATDTGSVAVVHQDQWRSLHTGQFIDKTTLINFLPLPSKSNTQDVEQDIQWRVFAFDSLVAINWNHEQWLIDQPTPAPAPNPLQEQEFWSMVVQTFLR